MARPQMAADMPPARYGNGQQRQSADYQNRIQDQHCFLEYQSWSFQFRVSEAVS
jgi:hypothetical protein